MSKIDKALLASMVQAGTPRHMIARAFGVSASAVTQACDRLGLSGARIPEGWDVIHGDAPDSVPASCPHGVGGGEFWTRGRDLEVWETGGRYAAIADLARKFGKSSAVILARWHKLRAAKGGAA